MEVVLGVLLASLVPVDVVPVEVVLVGKMVLTQVRMKVLHDWRGLPDVCRQYNIPHTFPIASIVTSATKVHQ